MNQSKLNTDKSKSHEYLILIFIMLVGAVLRFWDYYSMPFMHDELSALSRLQFDNFSDLIREGVMLGDTHPAGVQVFLYYWTAIVGTSEPMVKLPFIISGILSIWISYLIGKLWFDGTTGLLTAVYISSLQFFVMYSQIARPYISGLLITLLMVYMWSLYFFKNKKPIYLILYVLFGAMASYNHHFSLLFAAIVGISGLFLVKKKEAVPYVIAGVAIFVLYIPHLHIFFSQLGQGGIGGEGGWLAKPEATFFLQFLDYIFQFSWWVWLSLFAGLIYVNVGSKKRVTGDFTMKKRWLLFTWFILPIAIGFGYSVLRNPIVQYSMLIFSTPYLFILLFSYHKKLKIKQISFLVTLLLIVNILSLVYSRDHYNIFYKQPYEETFKEALLKNNGEDVFLIDDCIPYYNEYYFNKFGKRVPYFTKRNADIDIAKFEDIVSNIKEEIVIAEAASGEELQIIQSYFPYQVGYEQGFTYEIYTFSKNKPKSEDIIVREVIAQTDFESGFGNWKDVSNMITVDTASGNSYCNMSSSNEWGPSISFDLNEISQDGLGIVDVELQVMTHDTSVKGMVVASIIDGSETIYWKAINFGLYKPEIGIWKKVFLSLNIQGALKSRKDMDGLVLKVNIWNPKENSFLINYIHIYLKPGNLVRYGLYNKIYR